MSQMLNQCNQTYSEVILDSSSSKTLSNSNFNNDESIAGNTITQNIGELYSANNIFDSNLEDDFMNNQRPQITNGVIFSKIWSSKEKSQPFVKTEEDFKAKVDWAVEVRRYAYMLH